MRGVIRRAIVVINEAACADKWAYRSISYIENGIKIKGIGNSYFIIDCGDGDIHSSEAGVIWEYAEGIFYEREVKQ